MSSLDPRAACLRSSVHAPPLLPQPRSPLPAVSLPKDPPFLCSTPQIFSTDPVFSELGVCSWASAHELFGPSCSPGTSPSRQAKRSSPLPARGTHTKSKPKSLRIPPLYHESKGALDAASSPSTHSRSSKASR